MELRLPLKRNKGIPLLPAYNSNPDANYRRTDVESNGSVSKRKLFFPGMNYPKMGKMSSQFPLSQTQMMNGACLVGP